MKTKIIYLIPIFLTLCMALTSCSKDEETTKPVINSDFDIVGSSATYNSDLEQIELSIEVAGLAGKTTPAPIGQLDGAPVLAYVFPTNLKSNDVGFGNTDGVVALALTSHPDFDDTPLWDENNDKNFANDGIVWHPHWVLLVNDERVGGGLSVKQFAEGDKSVVLPPTNPGMPMYMDSPGYQVITQGDLITVVVPTAFVNNKTSFNFDAVTAKLRVNTSDGSLPLLGVYEVYEIQSGDLSLPYQVQ